MPGSASRKKTTRPSSSSTLDSTLWRSCVSIACSMPHASPIPLERVRSASTTRVPSPVCETGSSAESVMRTPTRGSSSPFGRGRCVTSSEAIASSASPETSVTS